MKVTAAPDNLNNGIRCLSGPNYNDNISKVKERMILVYITSKAPSEIHRFDSSNTFRVKNLLR